MRRARAAAVPTGTVDFPTTSDGRRSSGTRASTDGVHVAHVRGALPDPAECRRR